MHAARTLPWIVLLTFAGCGARSGLGDLEADDEPADAGVARDARPARDARVADAAVSCADRPAPASCVVGWTACHPIHRPIELTRAPAQSPDVAWSGSELLVVFDRAPGVVVTGVTLEGEVAWTADVGGVQQARIAYDVEACAGMVVADSAVRWLGADGRPVGELARLPFMEWQLGGDIAETASGFVLASGAIAHGEDPPGFFYDRFGRAPGGIALALVDAVGPRAIAEHDTDEDGRATLIASTTWDGTAGELYDAGDVGPPLRVDGIGNANGHVVGVAALGDDVFLLRSREGWTLTLEQRSADGTMRAFLLGESPRGSTGHLMRLGDGLVVASNAITPDDRVTVAGLRPDRDPILSVPMPVATRAHSHSPRLTPIPFGFAVAWSETDDPATGLYSMVQLFECCLGD